MANEKRLIDAHEFWNRLSHVVYDIFTVHEKDGKLTGTASVGYYIETIEEVLKQTKTVDAVEVCRCKDCIGWCSEKIAKEYEVPRYCTLTRIPTDPDDFCSYGERRTE